MKTRCGCPTTPAWSYYGGRGITVCDEWKNSFEAFRDWALASGYSNDLEIDRIDVNGNYEPVNCRWATRSQQMANTRKRKDAKTSGFKGVSFVAKRQMWRAQFMHSNVRYEIGLFPSEIEAAKAYNETASRVAGGFAVLNPV